MPSRKRIKEQPPGNTTTEQNAAQLSHAERDNPSRVTRTRTSLVGQRGKATPEAFDNLNSTNADAGKRREPRQLRDARRRLSAKRELQSDTLIERTDQTKTAPQGAIISPELQAIIDRTRGIQQQTETNVVALREIQQTRQLQLADQLRNQIGLRPELNFTEEQVRNPIGLTPELDFTEEDEVDINISNNIRIEDNILTKFDVMTYNFRLFMTGELATSSTLSTEDIVVSTGSGSRIFFSCFSLQLLFLPSLLAPKYFTTAGSGHWTRD